MTDNLSVDVFGELMESEENNLTLTAEEQAAVVEARAEARKYDKGDVDNARHKGRIYYNLKLQLGHGKYGKAIEDERALWLATRGADGMKWSQKTAEKYTKLHELYISDELGWVWKEFIVGHNLGIEDSISFCDKVLKGSDPHQLFAAAFNPQTAGELPEGQCPIDPMYRVFRRLVDEKLIHADVACEIIEYVKAINEPRLLWAAQFFGFRDVAAANSFYKVLQSWDEATRTGFDPNDLCQELEATEHIMLENGDQIELWKARSDEIWNAYAKRRKEHGSGHPKSVKEINKQLPYEVIKRIADSIGDDELIDNIAKAPQGVIYTVVVSRVRIEGEKE